MAKMRIKRLISLTCINWRQISIGYQEYELVVQKNRQKKVTGSRDEAFSGNANRQSTPVKANRRERRSRVC